jgi:uncharacterized protein (TIGR00266 family)
MTTSSQFNVILTGELAAGAEREQVIAAFAQRFGVAPDKAAALFSGRPVVVKRDIDAAAAQRLCAALQQIGAIGAAQPVAAPPAAAAAVSGPVIPTSAPRSVPLPPAQALPEPVPPRAAAPPVRPQPAPIVAAAPQPGLKFSIEGQPDFAFLTVRIPAGETLKVEASAMATMDTHVRMKTRLRGGLGRFLTGESIFLNEFTAEGGEGAIGIAPPSPGDLRHLHLADQTVYLQNSGFVAATMDIAVESKWQGLTKGFFSGESLFLLRCQGRGDLWFASYGGIIEIDISGDYVVDTGNIVAFTDGLEYRITKVGGYKSLFFSGEGLVCRFSGQGKVWIQTRKLGAFVRWVWPFRRVAKRG